VQRVVCWARLRGSGTARSLSDHGWGLALGRSSELLLDGLPDWQGKAEVGLIAGSVPHGLGSLLGAMDASDGTVALAETRLPGLADHCVVRTSHSGLVVSPDAARQTAHFPAPRPLRPQPRRGGGIGAGGGAALWSRAHARLHSSGPLASIGPALQQYKGLDTVAAPDQVESAP
jgi:hypothetical protein